MTNENKRQINWKGLIPRGRLAIISMAIVAVLAFSLGGLLFNGGNSDMTSENDGHIHNTEIESAQPTTWTCSMHPQIKLPKEGKCPICFMDLIPLESGHDDELDPNQLKMSEAARTLARIETSPVRQGLAEAEIRMVGKIEYDETRLSYITAWVPGRIDKLFADYTGTTVRKGEKLVKLYSPELISAQEELIQASRAVDNLQNSNSSLKSTALLTLDASRDKLRLFGLTEGQIDKIESSGKITEHITITAPASGIVTNLSAREGMYVKTGSQIYTIADLSELWVMFDAYESDLPWLSVGQHAEFTSQSMPGEKFEGEITFIDPILNPKTRIARVRATVDNRDGRLKPDMFVSGVIKSSLDGNGKIITKIDENDKENVSLLIPASAALLTGTRAVVYVEILTNDGAIYEGREVELGSRAGDFYIIKSGLSEGEMVVTNGAFKIDSEMQIQAKPSMMYVDGGGGATGHQHGQPSHSASDESDIIAIKRIPTNPKVTNALTPVYDAYIEVQMSLALDDFEKTSTGYKNLKDVIEAVDMGLFDGEGHKKWMELLSEMLKHSNSGITSKNIEESRVAFNLLSNSTIELHNYFGHAVGQDYFLTYCPMAFDNKGAYWIQTIDTVYNSYYGEMMLRCGEIKQKLSSGM
jgi:membrane fusion protein, copper/silver efflux system